VIDVSEMMILLPLTRLARVHFKGKLEEVTLMLHSDTVSLMSALDFQNISVKTTPHLTRLFYSDYGGRNSLHSAAAHMELAHGSCGSLST